MTLIKLAKRQCAKEITNPQPTPGPAPEPDANQVNYDEAVREAKHLLAAIDSHQWRLGELADRLEPRYGEKTLEKFAEAIGIAPCTVERYRDVYRAWKSIPAPGRESVSYSVMRELASLEDDDKAKIVADNPTITKREARKIKDAHQKTKPPADDGDKLYADQVGEKWNSNLLTLANKVLAVPACEKWPDVEFKKTVATRVRLAADRFSDIADHVEGKRKPKLEPSASAPR
jgi:hypothetical protein